MAVMITPTGFVSNIAANSAGSVLKPVKIIRPILRTLFSPDATFIIAEITDPIFGPNAVIIEDPVFTAANPRDKGTKAFAHTIKPFAAAAASLGC